MLYYGTKRCPECKKNLKSIYFYKCPSIPGGLSSYCIKCAAKRDKLREHRFRQILTLHGLSKKEYLNIIKLQNNKCAICNKNLVIGRWTCVDHDHKCCIKHSCNNCRRGILCFHCNLLLGHAKDKIDVLKSAIKYLRRWQ